ncbi:MAG: hypothetical protein FWC43_11020 [Planctomycetaceae bacterium]|nr:hypothetical protein [Planctomycetaceae bacterium]
MEIAYANSRVEKICTDAKRAKKKLGQVGAHILSLRFDQIIAAGNLEELRFLPGNYHELTADRKGELAVSLHGLTRLIFEPNHKPRPEKFDGGLNWSQVTAITILEITDYHK